VITGLGGLGARATCQGCPSNTPALITSREDGHKTIIFADQSHLFKLLLERIACAVKVPMKRKLQALPQVTRWLNTIVFGMSTQNAFSY
jgi:hypothetical protein